MGLVFAALAVVAFFYFSLKSKEYVPPQTAAMRALTAASASQPVFLFQNGFPSGVAADLQLAGADPVERAQNFLDTYRDLYLLSDPEMAFEPNHVVDNKSQTVVFSQTYRGLPVYSSQIAVGLNGNTFKSTTGKLLHGDLSLDTIPTITPAQALDAARQALNAPDAILSHPAELMVFDLALLTDVPSDPHLVYLLDLETQAQPRAFVDAHSGELVTSYDTTEPALDFVIYDGLGLNFVKCEITSFLILPLANQNGYLDIPADRTPIVAIDLTKAVTAIQNTYNFYWEHLFRDSYDNLGGPFYVVVQIQVAGTVAKNAGCYLLFNPGWVTTDLVAHEFTHSVIGSTSGLEYIYQSGALNESYADIMASMVDGNWTIAEDVSPFRSLSDPTLFSQPDRYGDFVSKPASVDNGGVHINSGIMNKAAYLITDGDTFNGVTIQPLNGNLAPYFFYASMITLPSNASLYTGAFNMRYNIAPDFLDKQGVCTVENALYAVQLLQGLDQNCDGVPDNPDNDGDSVPLQKDNCPDLANPDQLDQDKDHQGDACDDDIDGDKAPDKITTLGGLFGGIFNGLDNCPTTPNPDQADADKDGIGDACDPYTTPDTDGDGVLDDTDNCTFDPNPKQTDSDEDGFGNACDPDADGDGVANNLDNCYLPNPDQKDTDGDGLGNACDWTSQNPGEITIDVSQLGPVSLAVPACEPDKSGWYSQDFANEIALTGVPSGVASWISSPTQAYLSKPLGGESQTHFFNPRMGDHYFLNFAFADDLPEGTPVTFSIQSACGLFETLGQPKPQPETQTATPTPEISGLTLPYLTLLQNGNCRMEPGTSFELLDSRPQGFQASINGRTPDSAWLRVFLPEWNANCWFAASIVTVQGPLDGITIFLYPPAATFTPEPTERFVPQCSDGIDNDGDGFIDGVDRECSSPNDNDEAN
jgi:Zn-dependent metalloprotease